MMIADSAFDAAVAAVLVNGCAADMQDK